ncbi:MAG: hypothetical protein B7Z55_01065 [Planctomycetales bacterium 12-60-4]|nr:MAG: hypothetical protein B7Z55_01065 [Planctomycetales bacterium 12-60-4]
MASRRPHRPHWLGPMVAQDELVAFVFVNALDVFMTYWMLREGGFVESNPIANWFLAGWGPKGIIYFKFSVVAGVCVIAHIVGQYRPELAARFLTLGSVIVAAVVAYSLMLYLKHGSPAALAMNVRMHAPVNQLATIPWEGVLNSR